MSRARKNESAPLAFVAGATAGAVEGAVSYPFEFLKTQAQLSSTTTSGTAQRMPNVILLARSTVQAHGVSGLYTGVGAVVAGAVAKAGVRFAAYERFKTLLADPEGKVSGTRSLAAGLGAGMLEAMLVITPSETIKTKLIDDQRRPTPRYHGLVHGTSTIIQEEGILGIYRGLFPTMVRQGLISGVRFWSYSGLKALVAGNTRPGEVMPTGVTMVIASLSGAATVLATQPFDVVKTRMQSLTAKEQYRNSFHCSARIFSEESLFTFWRGTTPRLARFMISTPIIFVVYEQVIAISGARQP
ncbi:mitochondrial carrier [Meredithblackwellia eburnea MCA 4105]